MSMDDDVPAPRAVSDIRALIAVRRWTLWRQSPVFIGYCLLIQATAIGFTVVAARAVPVQAVDLVVLGVLAALGIAQAELGRHIERRRRRLTNTPHINLSSVWTFAGVLLLPPVLLGALVASLYGHMAVRSWVGLSNTPPFRSCFNACLVIVECLISYRVLTWSGVGDIHGAVTLGWASSIGIGAALASYYVVAAIITLPGLKPANRTLVELFGGWMDNLLELFTLLAGAVVALLLVTPVPYLIVSMSALLYIAHHGVLAKQMELALAIDDKTGLFNLRGWHSFAATALSRAERHDAHGAVLMIDLDHFKRVNDTYGHLAGDDVLMAVGEAIKASIRHDDAAGRFGGEEFTVLLPDVTTAEAVLVAERIRRSIARLEVEVTADDSRPLTIRGLSASIGVAPYPDFGWVVKRLVHKADTALRYAKEYGRNKVHLAA